MLLAANDLQRERERGGERDREIERGGDRERKQPRQPLRRFSCA